MRKVRALDEAVAVTAVLLAPALGWTTVAEVTVGCVWSRMISSVNV
jgi:hypothetical protein